MKLYIPLRVVNENNLREHWAVKAKRAKTQRMVVACKLNVLNWMDLALLRSAGTGGGEETGGITLTRIAPRMLDASDNLPNSFKHVVDAIAAHLGLDDRHLRFVYAQRKGKPKEYGIEIEA